jgi:hypothetical protein
VLLILSFNIYKSEPVPVCRFFLGERPPHVMVNASEWSAFVPAIPWPQSIMGNVTFYVLAMSMYITSLEYIESWVLFISTFIWTNKILFHFILFVLSVVLHLMTTEKHQNIVIQLAYAGVLFVLLWFGESSPVSNELAKYAIIEITPRFSDFVTYGTSRLATQLRSISVRIDSNVGMTVAMRREIQERTPEYDEEVQANYHWYDGGERTRRSGSDRLFELEQAAIIDYLLQSPVHSFCQTVQREMIPLDRCNRQDLEERKIALCYFFVGCLVMFICYTKTVPPAYVTGIIQDPVSRSEEVPITVIDAVEERVKQRSKIKTDKIKSSPRKTRSKKS